MKRFVISLIIMFLIFFSSCHYYYTRRVGPSAYDTDFTVKYERTLNAMFNNEWIVNSVEEKHDEGEEACGCGIPGINPHTFLKWTIGYRDGNGEFRSFVFNNRSSLSDQIEDHVRRYIAEYYKENFFNVYIRNLPLAPSSNVSGSFVRASVNTHLAENREWNKRTIEYRRLLSTPEGTINLAKLTPANVFEMVPIHLSIRVSFSEYIGEKQAFEKSVMRRIEAMIATMNTFTNYTLNADVSMGYHQVIHLHTGRRQYRWSIIQGERVHDVGMYYSRYVFESYRGVFW